MRPTPPVAATVSRTRSLRHSKASRPRKKILKTFHTETPGQQNFWYQFISIFRPRYLSAGKVMVDLLQTRGDPRLAEFFAPVGGEYVGAPPGSSGSFSLLNPATLGARARIKGCVKERRRTFPLTANQRIPG